MTREEAVEVLKERYLTCVGIGLDNHANRVNEAFDMAVEALSEPRGDLISRADAIQTFIRWGQKEFGFSDLNREERFIDAINALPSALADIGDYADRLWKIAYERGKAEAEAEHDHEPGQWQTENGKPSKAEYSVYCSKCGSWSEYRTKYCGNCGSLMKEENDDEK